MGVKQIGFRRPEHAEARFWDKVDKSGECWEWTASLTNTGYGQFQPGMGMVTAHRMSWTLANGEIPHGMCVLHRCDNRKCVRPDHLFLGTIADNNKDMCAKGRHVGWSWRRGKSKVGPEQVAKIREMAGAMARTEIARLFGISASHVGRIARGEFPRA